MHKSERLPKGWTIAKLGELVITEKGKKPKLVSKVKTKECCIPYVNINAFEKKIIDEYTDGVGCVLCEDDDFLMFWDGSRSGYVGKAIKGALGSTLVRIKLLLVNQGLIYYFLKSKCIEINSRAKGVGIPHVDPNLLWNYDFPLAPLNEQKRILAKLEQLLTDLYKGIQHLETTKQQLKVYRQAVLKWAFEGKFIKSDYNWQNIPLGNVANAIDPQPSHLTPPISKDAIPYVSTKDVDYEKDSIDFSLARKVSKIVLKEHLDRYKLENGDFIIGKIGTIGKPVRIVLPQNYTLSANVVLIQPRKVNSKFLFYLFKSDFIESQFRKGQKATAQAAFGIQKVRTMDIPYPEPCQQERIVQEIESRLSVCVKIEETIESSLQQAEALRLSITKKAFAGKLVPQDPNDEPAEKLLERIRALRQAQGKQGNGKPEKKEKAPNKKTQLA